MTKTVVVYHSGYGHTQRVAQFVAEGAKATVIAIDADGNITDAEWETLNAADAIIFGPQFGAFHGASAWRSTLGGMRAALRTSDACLGRRTLTIFRSPAFNFDPVNTFRQQAAFSRHMRPLVEEAGMVYVDNYPATYDAVFQQTPHEIKFAKNSAFHYLNAGRYLMAQILLHAIRLLAPAARLQ
jgi:hypothetical protein